MRIPFAHFVLAVTVFCSVNVEAQVEFESTATLSVLTPEALTSADFNGDGHADVAVASTVEGEVLIALGDGTGAFPETAVFDTGSPYHLAVADMNGDDFPDLVAANLLDGDFTVLCGDGLGGFVAQPPVPCGALPTSVATADFDEDGFTDVALTCHGSETVEVYFGNGLGQFSQSVSFGFLQNPSFLVAGDFTHDGHADLVVSNSIDSTFGLFHGNGDGQFPIQIPFNLGVDDSVWSITKHDLNGDGRLDLVAPCPNQNMIALLLGTPGGGFSPSVTYFTGEQPRAAVLARFGNDLHADLATVNSGSDDLSLREGDGSGTFGGATSYATGSNAVAIAVLDFDGDGRMDLSVANLLGHTVTLYRNITAEPPFLRGDVNNDGMINLADPVSILGALFLGSSTLTCPDAADTDDSGQLGIGDAILSLSALFGPGSLLPTSCELDDTADSLPSCAYATTVCP